MTTEPNATALKNPGTIDPVGTMQGRTVPMEILMLGLCRTGTFSLGQALTDLGYQNIYHMKDIIGNEADAVQWTAALQAKFEGKGKPFTKAQFDSLMGTSSGGSDIPFAFFVEEMIEMYPNAKIILTTRSADSWYTSMMNTVLATQGMSAYQWLMSFSRPSAQRQMFEAMFRGPFKDIKHRGRQIFLEHELHVWRAAPKDRFLEFNPKQGWAPLCEFLGKDIPDKPFPNVNDTASFQKRFEINEKQALNRTINRISIVLPMILLGAYAWQKGYLRA